MSINKDYLAQKEKEIIEAAEEVKNTKMEDIVGQEEQYVPKLSSAKEKVIEKLAVLEDYYKLWEAIKNVDFNTNKGKESIDKQVYSFIFKTYQDIKKETLKFNELKDRIVELIQNKEND